MPCRASIYWYPTPTLPHAANLTFRRAVAYAIDRDTILKTDLCGGRVPAGCQVISGPFPIGFDRDGPLGYAYDRDLSPTPFEPALAKTLFEVAETELATMATKSKLPIPPRIAETCHWLLDRLPTPTSL